MLVSRYILKLVYQRLGSMRGKESHSQQSLGIIFNNNNKNFMEKTQSFSKEIRDTLFIDRITILKRP